MAKDRWNTKALYEKRQKRLGSSVPPGSESALRSSDRAPCGCRIANDSDGFSPFCRTGIEYCTLHGAAPELLASLKEAMDYIRSNTTMTPARFEATWRLALDAIAQAEGTASTRITPPNLSAQPEFKPKEEEN